MDLISLALYTLCAIVIFTILSIVYDQYVIRQKLKNVPQTGGLPFIGVIFQVMNLSEYERLQWFLSYMNKYAKEGIFINWIGGKPFVNIFKPEYFEKILPSTVNITKGDDYAALRPWLGNGLLLSTGKQWFHDRRLIGPTFHFSILDHFAVVMSEKAEILTKRFEKEISKNSGKAFNIFPLVVNAALDIICETAMGVNIHAQETESKYTSSVHTASMLILDRILRPWYWSDFVYYLVTAGKTFKSAVETLHAFTNGVINKRKAERQSENNPTQLDDEDNDIGKRKRKAFLDLLLDQNATADTPLTDEELRAQVDTFMFEGHDTTAVAITWTLFLLGNNLEHQERVHEELEQVFGDSETPVNVKQLSELKYLERVIKESLRIFPSVPVITRQLMEDVKFENYTIPKDTTVSMDIVLAHRNPTVWPDPLKFDPDRFLPENSRKRNTYAYVPFSAGPRNCIGQRFAQIEEKILLIAILRKWKVKSVKTIDAMTYGGSLILRPNEEVCMQFTPKK